MDYRIEKFDKFIDHRGQLVVFLRNRDLEEQIKTFGQIYFVTFTKKGVVRGNHYHKKIREWFGVVSGKLKVVLEDVKTKEKEEITLDGEDNSYVRLEIGPNIAHAFSCLSKEASLLNYTDEEWSPEDVYSHKLL